MEYITNNDRTFLEDLLALRDTPTPTPDPHFNFNNCFPNTPDSHFTPTITHNPQSQHYHYDCDYDYDYDSPNFPLLPISDPSVSYAPFDDVYSALPYLPPAADTLSSPHHHFNLDAAQTPPLPNYDDFAANCYQGDNLFGNVGPAPAPSPLPCKLEPLPEMPAPKSTTKQKKVTGQPSKNLMAERRRRKRLNDRLSMLRSVVPKISKMDRTSILGDTIDYMKELLESINTLQEDMQLGSDEMRSVSIFKDVKPNEVLVRNSPKFEVERRIINEETRIEICCGGKPGLLLSTVTTLEALGLEIKHCVISCFNDFALQASCSEELKKRAMLDTEEIKQALLRNAGYGGKCM